MAAAVPIAAAAAGRVKDEEEDRLSEASQECRRWARRRTVNRQHWISVRLAYEMQPIPEALCLAAADAAAAVVRAADRWTTESTEWRCWTLRWKAAGEDSS